MQPITSKSTSSTPGGKIAPSCTTCDDGLMSSSRSSGPQAAHDRGGAVLAVVHDLDGLGVDRLLDVHHRLELEEVVAALGHAADDRLGVDQVAAVGPGEVQLALRGLLDHETRIGVGEQEVAGAAVRERTGQAIRLVGHDLRAGLRRQVVEVDRLRRAERVYGSPDRFLDVNDERVGVQQRLPRD